MNLGMIIQSYIKLLIKSVNKSDHVGKKVYIEICNTDFVKIAERCWDHVIL